MGFFPSFYLFQILRAPAEVQLTTGLWRAISERFPGGWRPLRAAEHVVALHQAGQRSGGTDGADWGWISSASQEVFGVENDDFLSHRN